MAEDGALRPDDANHNDATRRMGIPSEPETTNRPEPPARPLALIVHGYWATPESHWFGWLASQLGDRGYEVRVPALPDSRHPRPDAWLKALCEAAPACAPDDRTLVIAHSLGCVAALRWLLDAQPAHPIAGVLLVAPFAEPVHVTGIPADESRLIDEFASTELDYEGLRRLGRARTVISAEDDPVVPHAASARLASRLGARLVSPAAGGHFLAEDGYETFPLALAELERFTARS